jgi:hypothetical protein
MSLSFKEDFMNKLTAFFKKLRLRQVLTVFLAGVLLIISTACNSANTQGANPTNPPVQAGGANNPYKSGGDKYTNLKMSTDPKVSKTNVKGQQSNLDSSILVAANDILYPGAETPAGRAAKETELPIKTNKDFTEPKIGGTNQRNPDLGERVENRVEAATDAFKEAAGFVKDKADEAGRRPEAQSNPALHK